MVFLMTSECHCCQKAARTWNLWHCEYCWDNHHNGLRDKDWQNKEEFERTHDSMIEKMERGKYGFREY